MNQLNSKSFLKSFDFDDLPYSATIMLWVQRYNNVQITILYKFYDSIGKLFHENGSQWVGLKCAQTLNKI